jgi:hypothetical protein
MYAAKFNHSWQVGRVEARTAAAVGEFSRSVSILGMYQLNQKPDTMPGAVAVKETGV